MGSKRAREDDNLNIGCSSRISCEAWISGSLVEKNEPKDANVVSEKQYYCPVCCLAMKCPVKLHSSSNTDTSCGICSECAQFLRELKCYAKEMTHGFHCPICQLEVSLAELDLKDDTNRAAESHSDYLNLPYMGEACNERIRRRVLICGACEERSPSVFCMQCDFALCEDCQTTMHSKKCFQYHHTMPLDQAISLPEKCGSHPDHNMDLFCKECRCTGCIKCCFSGAHQGHDVAPLSDVASTSMRCVEEAIEKSKNYGNKAADTRVSLQKNSLTVKEAAKELKKQISDGFEELRQILLKREKRLLEEVDQKVSPTIETLSNAISQCEAIESSTARDTSMWDKAKTHENNLAMAHLIFPLHEASKMVHGLYDETLDTLSAVAMNISEMVQADPSLEEVVGQFSMKRRGQDLEAYRDFEEELHYIGDLCSPHQRDQYLDKHQEDGIINDTATAQIAHDSPSSTDVQGGNVTVCKTLPLSSAQLFSYNKNGSNSHHHSFPSPRESHPCSVLKEGDDQRHSYRVTPLTSSSEGMTIHTLSTSRANNVVDRASSVSIASYSSAPPLSLRFPNSLSSGGQNYYSSLPAPVSVSSLSLPTTGRFLSSVSVNATQEENSKEKTTNNLGAVLGRPFVGLENVFQS